MVIQHYKFTWRRVKKKLNIKVTGRRSHHGAGAGFIVLLGRGIAGSDKLSTLSDVRNAHTTVMLEHRKTQSKERKESAQREL